MERHDVEPLSTREILKCAMQNEKIASENYNAIGEIMLNSHNFAVAKIFFESSKVEKGHYNKLQKALKRLYGISINEETPLPYSTECVAGSGDNACAIDIRTGMSQGDAITFLEDAERSAQLFYEEAVKRTDRPDLKALFRMLGDEEGRHRTLIKKIARKAQTRSLGTASTPTLHVAH